MSDIINDRIDVTSKAFLGLTVTCARCHDHKFDPIPTADYYSLYGIFASSIEPADKPVIAPPNAAHAEYLVKRRDMDERIKTMREQNMKERVRRLQAAWRRLPSGNDDAGEPACGLPHEEWGGPAPFCRTGSDSPGPRSGQAFPIFGVWNALSRIPAERFAQQAPAYPDESCMRRNARTILSPIVLQAFKGQSPRTLADVAAIYGKLFARTDPEWEAAMSAVLDARCFASCRSAGAESIHAAARTERHARACGCRRAGPRPRPCRQSEAEGLPDFHSRPGGNSRPDRAAPFSGSICRDRTVRHFKNGSGRLELANAIANKTNPLTARVMVNRVWQHHFGDGFVSTPDDLGNQSSPPTHPELLDWLASRFMTDGWSVKKLHKLILLSATWQQSSRNNPQFAEKDPFNHLLWRANVRRLEFEPLRDSILSIGGTLDLTVGWTSGGPLRQARAFRRAVALPQRNLAHAGIRLSTDPRRSVYGYVDRGDLEEVLNTFDFREPGHADGQALRNHRAATGVVPDEQPAGDRTGPQRRQPGRLSGRGFRRGTNPVSLRTLLSASPD